MGWQMALVQVCRHTQAALLSRLWLSNPGNGAQSCNKVRCLRAATCCECQLGTKCRRAQRTIGEVDKVCAVLQWWQVDLTGPAGVGHARGPGHAELLGGKFSAAALCICRCSRSCWPCHIARAPRGCMVHAQTRRGFVACALADGRHVALSRARAGAAFEFEAALAGAVALIAQSSYDVSSKIAHTRVHVHALEMFCTCTFAAMQTLHGPASFRTTACLARTVCGSKRGGTATAADNVHQPVRADAMFV